MAKRRIRSTEKMARSYEPGGVTDERNARLGAVRSRSASTASGGNVTVDSSTAVSAQPGASQAASTGGGGFLPLAAPPGNATAQYALTQRDLTLPNSRVIGDSQEIDAVTRAPGRLSFDLRDGSIGTARLADDAVTYAKIQNVSASRLLGRYTASSGDVEEMDVTPPLTIDSGGKLLCSAPTVTVNGASTGTAIDLDDATPAVTAGSQNVTWSKDASAPMNISGKVFQGPTAFKVLSASANVTDGTGAQDWFPTNGDWTVTDDRCYLFEGTLRLSKGSGVATDVLVGFAGTATYTVDWEQMGQGLAADTAGNVQVSSLRTTTAQLAVSPSSTATNVWAKVWGVLRVTAAGTFIPQFQFTAAPGGTPQALRGTRFTLTEIGADTVTERGTWS